MLKGIMASVADAYIFAGDQLIAVAKALANSSMSVSVSEEEIRAGKGAGLIGRFFHSPNLTLEIMDALFQTDYIALNVGAIKTIGGSTLFEEEVTATVNGSLTATEIPTDAFGKGTIGWYAQAGQDNWTKITFVGGVATVPDVVLGKKYCLKYNINDDALEEVVISGSIVPSIVRIILKGDLFIAEKAGDLNSSTKIGYVETEIPNFQMNGNFDLTMNMTGASQTSLFGKALLTTDGSAGCEGGGYLAKIKEVQFNNSWTDSLIALAIENADIELDSTDDSATVVTYGVFRNAQSKIIDTANLTYTLGADNFVVTGNVVSKGTAVAGDKDILTVAVKDAEGSVAEIVAVANIEMA